MLLAVDIGNTNIKFGIFDGKDLLSKFSRPTSSDLSVTDLSSMIVDTVDDCIVCSVVPDRTRSLTSLVRDKFAADALVVSNELDFGLKINYRPLSSLGTDRIVNSFAAAEKYGEPCIVCSIGTATTFDVVSKDRELLGGSIAPGMKTSATALHLGTAELPEIEIAKPDSVIGHSTIDSLRSGVFHGHVAMIEGMVQRLRTEVGNVKVIATGGFAAFIAGSTTSIDIVDDDLLLDGLRLLHERLKIHGSD